VTIYHGNGRKLSNKTRILSVVDDEIDIMPLFRDTLSQIEDVNVMGFTDSTLALEHFKLNHSNYSLILSDFRIPVMDGIQLLKQVKSINPKVKTLLISAFEVNDQLFEGCNSVDTFLQKHVSMIDLIEKVKIQLSKPF
jgi:response regulator RpfG family c-di-GMP phosphodiesterase